MATQFGDPKYASDSLQHQWVVAGIISASARFIPIPFIDEVVRTQCRRFVVSRILANSDSDITTTQLEPYYSGENGCLPGCFGFLLKAPLKLVLFPIRKFVLIVTAARGVPIEIMRVVLLGRTLDRYLQKNHVDWSPADAIKMRRAFDESFTRMDLRVVKAAVADSLASVKGWKRGATETAQKVARSSDSGVTGKRIVADDRIVLSKDVEAGAEQVEAILRRPETLSLFAEFDQKFDAAFAEG